MNALLSFEGLAVARGDRVLLSGLRGELNPGEILHLRGANGVGKTTLLEVLCGLREPESGDIQRQFEPDACHWVGHSNALNPALTPFENLKFWCALNDTSAENLRAGLREFGLHPVADQPCRQLSAGQRRRCALSRLAVARRPIWFLDEPLSALDETGASHWSSLLADHQRTGGAAIITSHQALPAGLTGVRTWDLAR